MDNKLTKAELDLLSKAYDISVKGRWSKKDSGVAGSNAIMASEKMSFIYLIKLHLGIALQLKRKRTIVAKLMWDVRKQLKLQKLPRAKQNLEGEDGKEKAKQRKARKLCGHAVFAKITVLRTALHALVVIRGITLRAFT